MKILELALIGIGAYLIFANKGTADTGFTPSSGGGYFLPTTNIPTSPTLQKPIQNLNTSPQSLAVQAKANLGKINVTQAPQASVSPAARSEINQLFTKQYILGGPVPSSILSGKMTQTDVIIAQNLAKKSYK